MYDGAGANTLNAATAIETPRFFFFEAWAAFRWLLMHIGLGIANFRKDYSRLVDYIRRLGHRADNSLCCSAPDSACLLRNGRWSYSAGFDRMSPAASTTVFRGARPGEDYIVAFR